MLDSKSYGIYYNGHHSSEFGLICLQDKQVGMPAKNKILVDLPFSNNKLDLSNVYGSQIYGERTYTQVFNLTVAQFDKEGLYRLWTKVVNWLMSTSTKSPLFDDVMQRYYYLAEVQEAPEFEELLHWGTLTVKWQCYPFRISALKEGNDIWNAFDFDFDVAQRVKYTIDGSVQISLINNGASALIPTVIADADMQISYNGQTIAIKAGTIKDVAITLQTGKTDLIVTGKGIIEFVFNKELI